MSEQRKLELGQAYGYEAYFGVNFTHVDKDQAYAQCPFCGEEDDKFSVNTETTQFGCFHNGCPKGNYATFIKHYYEQCIASTVSSCYQMLIAKRGLDESSWKMFGLAWDHSRKHWWFPFKNDKGEVVGLDYYYPDKAENNKGTPWGLERHPLIYNLTAPEIFLCEGPWDGVAQYYGLTLQERLRFGIFAVPSSSIFKAEWVPLLKGKIVHLQGDHDDPGRGLNELAIKRLRGSAIRLTRLNWPEGTANKYDIGDLVRDKGRGNVLPYLIEHRVKVDLTEQKVEKQEKSFECKREHIEPPILGEAAYHGITGEFVRAVAPYYESNSANILIQFLAAIGVWIGPNVNVFAGSEQPTKIFVVVVGQTGRGRKGTAYHPVRQLLKILDENLRLISGMSTGEGVVKTVADNRRWDNETKTYEITPKVDKRVLITEEEFSKVLTHFQRNGNILAPIICQAFDTNGLHVQTKVDEMHSDGDHIGIIGHITPEILKKNISGEEICSGLCNRFLWFVVARDKKLPRTTPVPVKVYQTFAYRLRTIKSGSLQNVSVASSGTLTQDEEYHTLWADLYDNLSEGEPGRVGAVKARGETIIPRLALIYAILDNSKIVKKVHLEAALAIWQYNAESVQRLFSAIIDKMEGKILEKLNEAEGHRLSRTEIGIKIGTKKEKVQAINAALENLIANEMIEMTKERTEGAKKGTLYYELI